MPKRTKRKKKRRKKQQKNQKEEGTTHKENVSNPETYHTYPSYRKILADFLVSGSSNTFLNPLSHPNYLIPDWMFLNCPISFD